MRNGSIEPQLPSLPSDLHVGFNCRSPLTFCLPSLKKYVHSSVSISRVGTSRTLHQFTYAPVHVRTRIFNYRPVCGWCCCCCSLRGSIRSICVCGIVWLLSKSCRRSSDGFSLRPFRLLRCFSAVRALRKWAKFSTFGVDFGFVLFDFFRLWDDRWS